MQPLCPDCVSCIPYCFSTAWYVIVTIILITTYKAFFLSALSCVCTLMSWILCFISVYSTAHSFSIYFYFYNTSFTTWWIPLFLIIPVPISINLLLANLCRPYLSPSNIFLNCETLTNEKIIWTYFTSTVYTWLSKWSKGSEHRRSTRHVITWLSK